MDQAKMEILAAGGIDAADALDRMMGSEALLVRFLGKFLEDGTYQALRQAVEGADWDKALAASHTLKGMSGQPVHDRSVRFVHPQVALLRAGQTEEAAALMTAIEAAYGRAADAIGRLGRV